MSSLRRSKRVKSLEKRLRRELNRRQQRQMRLEPLEGRQLMAADWRNGVDSLDANVDGVITPQDALVIINEINAFGTGALADQRPADELPLDTNGDQVLTAFDALNVINYLNAGFLEEGKRFLAEFGGLAGTSDVVISLGQPAGSRNYQIQINAVFDTSDSSAALDDVLAVYLVDPAQPSATLLDRGTPGTALFTLRPDAQGTTADFIPGVVRWDGSVLTIDTSAVVARETGVLRFQLLQGDLDKGSRVTVQPLSNVVDATSEASPALAPLAAVAAAGSANTGSLAATTAVTPLIENVRYDASSGRYAADVRLRNDGPDLGRNVIMTLPNLPAGVTVRNPSGTLGGAAYFNFRSVIGSGGLAAGDVSRPVLIEFDNPGNTAFRWQPQILASANLAPTLAAIGPQTVIPGGHLEIPLVAADADGDLLTFSLTPGAVTPTAAILPSGKLVIDPAASDVGDYSFGVVVSDGIASAVRQVQLTVAADALTTTRVSGQVLQTSGQPIAGMKVEIGAVAVLTQADGRFTVDLGNGPVVTDTIKIRGEVFPGPASYPFIAEKLEYMLDEPLALHVNNVISRPIYLPALDLANGKQIDPTKDTMVTTAAIAGASVFVAAGTLMTQQGTPFTGTLSITNVPVELTPAALPVTLLPDLVLTVQPGEMVFATPAPMTFPNSAGYAPGTRMDLWSINPVTGEFDDVGDMQVSADGSRIDTISGGVRNSSWHFAAPPPPAPAPPPPANPPPVPPCPPCSGGGTGGGGGNGSGGGAGGGGSGGGGAGGSGGGNGGPGTGGGHGGSSGSGGASGGSSPGGGSGSSGGPSQPMQTGLVTEVKGPQVELIPTIRMDPPMPSLPPLFPPRPPVQTKTPTEVDYASGAVFGTKYSGGYVSQGVHRGIGLTYNSDRANPQSILHFGFNNAPANADNTKLVGKVTLERGSFSMTAPGVSSASTLGLPEGSNVWALPADGGDAFGAIRVDMSDMPTGYYHYTLSQGLLQQTPARFVGSLVDQQSALPIVNSRQSVFGAGWGIEGLQHIVDNPDGTAMVVDGGRSLAVFRATAQPNVFTPPPGDFSKLEVVAGRYRRTTPNQIVYQFDASKRLESVTDTNGNQTRYNYDAIGNLTKIIDPVGLETTFQYQNGKVASFTEPGDQTTQLKYDGGGNLIEVIDPDGLSQKYGYNVNHLLTAKTDRLGGIERLEYDFAGRLNKSIAADGSVRQFRPMQVEGLYPPEATLDVLAPPVATPRTPRSTIVDSLGNVTSILLDQLGQPVTAKDGVSGQEQLRRNEQNLVSQRVDARGHLTLYEYDAQGNVTRIRDEVSGASVLGTISTASEIDEYTFSVRAGDRLFYDGLGSKPGDIRATLSSPTGVQLLASVDADGNQGAFQLSETGTYRLRLHGNNASLGDYEFRVYVAPTTITQLPFEGTVTGSLTVPGELQVFQFAGAAGDQLFIDGLTMAGGDLRYTLVGPSGEYLVNFLQTQSNSGRLTLDEPGQYQLLVQGNADNTGSYSFRVVRPSSTTAPLVFESPISGTLEKPGDADIYTFSGAPGERIFLDGLSAAGGDLRYTLIGPTGEYLANFVPTQNNFLVRLDEAGAYRLVVQGNADNTGSYSLRVMKPEVSVAPLVLEQTVSGTIGEPGEQDIYTFTGAIGERLFFDGLSGLGGDLRYTLVGPTGEYLLNFLPTQNNGVVRLDEAGLYQLIVQGNVDNTGSYSLRVMQPAITSSPLTLDAVTSGSLDEPGDLDIYTFTGAVGDRLYIDGLTGTGGDLRYTLIGPTGEYLANFIPTQNNSAELRLDEAGSYQLEVQGNVDHTGSYSLQVFHSPTSTTALTLGAVTAGTIAVPGEVRTYTFAGTVGQQIEIDAVTNPTADLRYDLVAPTGELLVAGIPWNQDRGPLTLKHAGTYLLRAYGSAEATGNFSFRVLDLASNPLPIGTFVAADLASGTAVYRWSASAGQRLAFDSQTNLGGQWQIIGPGGQVVANTPLNTDFTVTAADGGGLYALLLNSGLNAGTFTFQASDVSDAAVVPGGLNEVKTGSVTAGETDSFTYEVSAGTLLHLDIQGIAAAQLRTTLTAPGGQQVFLSDDMGDRFAIAPRSGTYTLTVQGDNAASTGDYTLKLTNTKTVSTPLTLGANVTGALAAGEVDFYRFEGSVGDRLTFNTHIISGPNLRYTLISPSGGFVVDNADLRFDSNAFELLETGTYQVGVFPLGTATGNYDFAFVKSSISRAAANLGGAVTGTIALPGEADIYTLAATAGQRVIFDTNITSGANIRYHLISPSGAFVVNNGDARFDGNGFNLEETGDYQLVVFAFGEVTGNYDFRLRAATIAIQNSGLGSPLIGSLANPGDVDIYRVAGTAGQRVIFDTNITSGASIRYHLISPTGIFVVNNGDARFDGNGFNLEETGEYQLVIFAFGDVAGNYDLRLRPATINAETSAVDVPLVGSLATPGEVDIYRLPVAAGQRVVFDTNITSGASIRYNLISPSGDFVVNNGDTRFDSNGFNLEETGEYQLVVFAFGDVAGNYDLRLRGAAINIQSTALDAPLVGNIQAGEVDVYRIAVNAGQRVLFDTNVTSGASIRYDLVSPSGAYIVNNGDTRFDSNGFNLEETGEYQLKVFAFGDVGGNYDVRLRPATINTSSTALGLEMAGGIGQPGEVDIYSFTAAAGQRLLVDSGLATTNQIRYHLISPTGAYVINAADINNDTGLFRLAESGTFQVVVFGIGAASGSYSLRLINADTPTLLPAGQTVAGQLNPGRTTKAYGLSAQAGQHLYFDALGTSNAGGWQVIGPNNQALASANLSNDMEFDVPVSGTYTLLVTGNSDSAVPFSFRMLPTVTTPLPLFLDTAVSGTIGQLGERDVYTFVGGSGQRLWLDSLSGTSNGLMFRVVSPTGTLIYSGLVTADSLLTLPASGPYRLEVVGTGGATGPYSFRVLNLETAAPLPNGGIQAGVVTPPLGSNAFRFSAVRGQRLRFDDLGTLPASGFWHLIAPGGNTLFTRPLTVDFDATIPATGSYTLVLSTTRIAEVVPFQFQVSDISDAPVAASGFGTVHAGTGVQSFPFTASAGTKLSLNLIDRLGPALYELRDPSGTILFDLNLSSDLGPFVLPRSGQYTLTASGAEFSFRLLNDADAPLAATNVPITGNLTQAFQQDHYAINGVPGRRLYFDMAGDTVGRDLRIALISPSGATVFDSVTALGGGPVTLVEHGRYLLSIGQQADLGSYTFRVLDAIAAPELELGTVINDVVSQSAQADVYRVPVSAGTTYTFDGSGQPSGVRLNVFGPDNGLLHSGNPQARFDLTPTFSGELLLVLDSQNTGGLPDPYRLFVNEAIETSQTITPATSPPVTGGGDWLVQYDPKFSRVTSVRDELGHLTLTTIDPLTGNKLAVTDVVGALGAADDITTTYTYTAAGLINTITDPLSRVTDYDYDALGRPITITYAKGTADEATVQYEYDVRGNITAFIDGLGRRTTYTYNSLNEVTSITDPDPDGAGPLAAPVYAYSYNAAGLQTSMTDARGGVTQYAYDAEYRLKQTTDPAGKIAKFEYNDEGDVSASIDELGRRTTYGYDARNRLIRQTDAHGNVWRMTYDRDDRLTKILDPLGNAVTLVYDARGRRTAIIDATGKRETWNYDAADNVTSYTDRNGNTTRFTYDDLNRLITTTDAKGGVTVTTYDKAGNAISSKDSLNRTTQFAYDALDRLVLTTDAQGKTRQFAYDDASNLISAIDELGRATTVGYDALDRAISVTDALLQMSKFTYDAMGNTTAVTDPLNRTTSYQYDALQRLTKVIDPLAQETNIAYDAVGNVTKITDTLDRDATFTYDALNRAITATDAAGQISRTSYDAVGNVLTSTDELGRVTSIGYDRNYRPVRMTDALGGVMTTSYDGNGNVIESRDQLGRVTRYQYDAFDMPVKIVDALGGETINAYDAVGKLVGMIDRLGRQTTYAYDTLDRLTRTTDPLGGQMNMTYDAVGNRLTASDERNHVTSYAYDALNRLTQATDALAGKTEFTYDAVGNRLSLKDANNRVTTFAFDALNRNTTVTDALNNVTTFTYDAANRLTSIRDALLRVTNYAYDSLDRLTRVTDPLGGQRSMTYDAVGNQLTESDERNNTTSYAFDALNRLTRITDPLTHRTDFTYDAVGNRLTVKDALNRNTTFAYDALNRNIANTDALGNVTKYAYDAEGNLTSRTDALQRVTAYSYDALNRLSRVTDPLGGQINTAYDATSNIASIADELNQTTTFSYDALNRLTRETDPLGGQTDFIYDGVGNVLSMKDALHRVTNYTYDALHRLASSTNPLAGVVAYTYDAVGNTLTIKDELDRVTTYDYDALDRVKKVTNAAAGVMRLAYDATSNLTSATDPLNRTTSYAYDALNRQLSVTSPLGHTAAVTYDAVGNVASAKDPLNQTYHYTYDALNRPLVRTDPLGGQTTNSYDAVGNRLSVRDELNRTTVFKYDGLDRLSEETNPLGNKTVFAYDAASRLTSVTDPLNHVTSYGYDVLNRRTTTTDPNNAVTTLAFDAVGNLKSLTDPLGNKTQYTYDDLDRLITDTNQLGDSRSYGYDAVGNQTSLIDRNGRKRTFTYDALNRRTAEKWHDSGDQVTKTLTYTFDAASQLTDAGDDASQYGFTYDADGRVKGVTNAGTSGAPTVAFNYTYDANSRLTSRNETIDGAIGATNSYAYDALDRVTGLIQIGTATQKRIDFTYDAASQLTGINRFASALQASPVAQSSYAYDTGGRLTSLTHRDGAATIAAHTFAFDTADRLTQHVSPDGTADHTYDARGQLTGTDNSVRPDEAFGYDANGNRNTAGNVTGANNRLTSDGTFTYEYDKEGNRTKRTEVASGKTTEYQYDYRNRLVSVTEKVAASAVASTAQYVYDAFDNRIAKTIDSDGAGAAAATTQRFVYDGNQVSLQFDGSGNLTNRYLQGPMVDQILADDRGGAAVLWPLTDHQGSVRDLVDSSGALVNHLTYDSFGRLAAETNAAVDHLFGYTGQQMDEETDLAYYRARYYDPATGQFISEDPIGFAAGDANLSRYVGNSPTNFTDPLGLCPANPPKKPPKSPPSKPPKKPPKQPPEKGGPGGGHGGPGNRPPGWIEPKLDPAGVRPPLQGGVNNNEVINHQGPRSSESSANQHTSPTYSGGTGTTGNGDGGGYSGGGGVGGIPQVPILAPIGPGSPGNPLQGGVQETGQPPIPQYLPPQVPVLAPVPPGSSGNPLKGGVQDTGQLPAPHYLPPLVPQLAPVPQGSPGNPLKGQIDKTGGNTNGIPLRGGVSKTGVRAKTNVPQSLGKPLKGKTDSTAPKTPLKGTARTDTNGQPALKPQDPNWATTPDFDALKRFVTERQREYEKKYPLPPGVEGWDRNRKSQEIYGDLHPRGCVNTQTHICKQATEWNDKHGKKFVIEKVMVGGSFGFPYKIGDKWGWFKLQGIGPEHHAVAVYPKGGSLKDSMVFDPWATNPDNMTFKFKEWEKNQDWWTKAVGHGRKDMQGEPEVLFQPNVPFKP